jgi:hypothetical protein
MDCSGSVQRDLAVGFPVTATTGTGVMALNLTGICVMDTIRVKVASFVNTGVATDMHASFIWWYDVGTVEYPGPVWEGVYPDGRWTQCGADVVVLGQMHHWDFGTVPTPTLTTEKEFTGLTMKQNSSIRVAYIFSTDQVVIDFHFWATMAWTRLLGDSLPALTGYARGPMTDVGRMNPIRGFSVLIETFSFGAPLLMITITTPLLWEIGAAVFKWVWRAQNARVNCNIFFYFQPTGSDPPTIGYDGEVIFDGEPKLLGIANATCSPREVATGDVPFNFESVTIAGVAG